MDNKKLIRVIIIIFVLMVISVVVILILDKEEKPNPIDVQCSFACESSQKDSFCFVERKVNDELTTTCDELSKNSLYTEYNVETCSAISCTAQPQGNSQLASDQTCVGLEGTWETPTSDGKCPTKEEFYARKRTALNNPPIAGQICCYYYQ
jgi:hypothetical protein